MEISSLLKGKKENTQEDLEILKERAEEIHKESTVIDGHVGTLFDVRYGYRDITAESEEGHVDIPRLKKAAVNAVFLSAFPDDRLYPMRGVRTALEYVDVFSRLLETSDFKRIDTARDIEVCQEEGKIGVLLSFEDGEMLEGSLEVLRVFYKLGLRMLGLTWNDRNLLADGTGAAITRGGLTPRGFEVLKEAERLGIIVDVSHLSEAGFWDVCEQSEMPFVVSHANCHAIFNHPHNLTDDQLKAVGEKGGVVGISFNPAYVGPGIGDESQEGAPDLDKVVEHVLHAVEVAGEDHVGIGSDFDSFRGKGPEPLTDISRLDLLTLELLKKGLSGKVISGILGGNWLRVVRAILG